MDGDLVDRLRAWHSLVEGGISAPPGLMTVLDQAAGEIVRLRAESERLLEVLSKSAGPVGKEVW